MTNSIKNPKKELLKKTRRACFHTVMGIIMPFLIGSLLLVLIFKFKQILTFLDKGDFCLYSVGLFTTAIYIFDENSGSIKKRIDRYIKNFLTYLLIFSAVIYGAIYLLQNIKIEIPLDINISLVRILSIILFFISIISLYRSFLLENLKLIPEVDVKKEREQEINKIIDTL